jgi:hypothetical protein
MNNLRNMVHRVPEDTRKVVKDLSVHCNLSESAIRKIISNPQRDMMATTAIRAIDYFNQFYPCSIQDLIEIEYQSAARKLKLTKPSSIILDRKRQTGRKRIATA